jgi:aminoglycoside phosphotransferase (APT) family kinase protein
MIGVVSLPTRPSQPDPAAIRRLLRAIGPGLRLATARPLDGGVSAQVTAIEAARPDGRLERLVLRQYGAADLRSDPHAAAHEYQLLSLLVAAGLPVPRPYLADESGAILPGPFLVIEFIDGKAITEPAQLTQPAIAFTCQLAATLAQLHKAGFTLTDAPYLADIRSVAARKMETWPTSLDEPLSEAAVRAALARTWPPPRVNRPVLLHGDYWPGNALWRDGKLSCVIDWEDAAFGDPLADVGNARMEICMAFGAGAMREFTRQYCTLMPALDLRALPPWDLYAALRHAGRMDGWGLPPADLARLRAGHREFVAVTLGQL